MALAVCLPQFEIRLLTLKQFSRHGHYSDFDAAFFASWRTIKRHMEIAEAFGFERCLVGVGSHYEIGPDVHSLPEGADPHRVRCEAFETLRRFRLVLAHSQPLFDILTPHVEAAVYAPNGVDADYFRPAGERRVGAPYTVGWLGREKAAKNMPLLMSVVEAMHREDTPIDLCLIGRNGIPYLSQSGVLYKYQWTWDFSLNVSHSEGMSNVLLESAACGVVPITVDVGDHCRLVWENATGFVVKPTLEDVTDVLRRLGRLPLEQYNEMSRNVHQEILENWTWPKRAVAYRKALETVCG